MRQGTSKCVKISGDHESEDDNCIVTLPVLRSSGLCNTLSFNTLTKPQAVKTGLTTPATALAAHQVANLFIVDLNVGGAHHVLELVLCK